MRALVTGSSGHLGEALVRVLRDMKNEVVSLDLLSALFTTHVGSVTDRVLVRRLMSGVQVVFHAATLHKPHVATHHPQEFIDTNLSGTLNLPEEAVTAGVESVVFTSTTSVFGAALTPPAGVPAAWVTEDVRPIPKNIYGVTKAAAEDLCRSFIRINAFLALCYEHRAFSQRKTTTKAVRERYSDENVKMNEFLYRRVDLEDVVNAHLLAARQAHVLCFRRYIITATTPFSAADAQDLRSDAPKVVHRHFPDYESEYARRGWKMVPGIDRVYVNQRARQELGWQPRYDFRFLLERLKRGEDLKSPLARIVGSKGYHRQKFVEGPYPVA